jgi:hypothetical protein
MANWRLWCLTRDRVNVRAPVRSSSLRRSALAPVLFSGAPGRAGLIAGW